MAHTSRRALTAALLPLLLFTGCMSASKRLDQGLRLEERGQPTEAARRYIDALRRDPTLANARIRLQETGAVAVEHLLAESDARGRGGAHGAAAESLLTLDALVRDAAGVGVRLPLPADYAEIRRAAFDRAIDQAHADADRLSASARFGDALGRLDRAAGRWNPSTAQLARIDEHRLDTFVGWSRHEADAGRFRASYQVAERGIAAFGGGGAALERLREAQLRAIDEGTVRVALLPIQVDESHAGALGAAFVRDLENELEAGAWSRPPDFIDVVDPSDVRAGLRRLRGADPRRILDAARLGRELDADLAIIVEIDSVSFTTTDERSERRTARTRSGADTAFTVVTVRSDGSVRLRYTVVDVAARSRVAEETVVSRASRTFRQARYGGDWRQLLLQRDDQRLFETTARDRARRELTGAIITHATETLPRSVFARVLRDVR
jgi:hypothetical protein